MRNEIQTVSAKRDIRAFIQSDAVKQQMAMVLPKHLTPDNMARVACTAVLKTPKLMQCKQESLLQALMICSQIGLPPDGRLIHLIPYGDVVQVIIDWKGLVVLAKRNGVANISADIVCENDEFEFMRTSEGLTFKHVVNYRKPRGEMFAAYCIWKDGDQFDGEVMTKDEIDGIRKRSKASGSGPWVTDYNEMAKKTVVRRSSKKWPLDPEVDDAINQADGFVAPKPETIKPIFGVVESPAAVIAPEVDDIPMGEPLPTPETVAKTINYSNGIRGLLAIGKITEAEFLDFMRSAHGWDDSLSTLEEVADIAPSKLKAAYEDWTHILDELKKLKAKGV